MDNKDALSRSGPINVKCHPLYRFCVAARRGPMDECAAPRSGVSAYGLRSGGSGFDRRVHGS